MNAASKVEADKLALWNALSKTDPAHTKAFKRAGGFQGTAIKPIWIVKMLTEQFGPCGEGWGMGEPSFQIVPCDGEILVFCTVSAWHGSPENQFWGVGGDKVQARRKDGAFCDDEAFKKAFTDAVNNAFKFVGVGADVHMGLFDDSKYLAEVRAEFEEREAANDPANDPRREPEARAVLEGPHKSKTALRTAINNLIAKVREAETVIALNELLKGAKETIDEANRYWPSLVEGHPDIEEDIGLKGAVTLRRQHLAAQPAEDGQYKMLIDSMKTCTSHQDLADWTATNAPLIEELDGVEARSFQLAYDLYASGLKAVATVAAG